MANARELNQIARQNLVVELDRVLGKGWQDRASDELVHQVHTLLKGGAALVRAATFVLAQTQVRTDA